MPESRRSTTALDHVYQQRGCEFIAMTSLTRRLEALERFEPEDLMWDLILQSFSPKVGMPLNADSESAWKNSMWFRCDEAREMLLKDAKAAPQFESRLSDPIERGFARMVFIAMDSYRPFMLEDLRPWVPNRILAALYRGMCGNAYKVEVRKRIWQLAGIADADGNPLQGHWIDAQGWIRRPEETKPDRLQ
jgi:hypothetical protein